MLVLDGVVWLIGECSDGEDAHASGVMGAKYTKVEPGVVNFDDEVVDPSDCLHERHKPPSSIRRLFLEDKFVIHQRVNPFVLVHVGTNVQVNKAFSLDFCA